MTKKEEPWIAGADNFVVSSDDEQMKVKNLNDCRDSSMTKTKLDCVCFCGYSALVKSLDFIIDTASGDHPFDPYMSILKTAGTLVLCGAPSEIKLNPMNLPLGMKTLSGSATGGTKQTQEMLDFCSATKSTRGRFQYAMPIL
uniref:Alcohol dehydrogenase-like C-terminal domain-containing protein n=1 Tax=Salix viminalis TaxID=40686 RepID=A0A6N2K029_SALVM